MAYGPPMALDSVHELVSVNVQPEKCILVVITGGTAVAYESPSGQCCVDLLSGMEEVATKETAESVKMYQESVTGASRMSNRSVQQTAEGAFSRRFHFDPMSSRSKPSGLLLA